VMPASALVVPAAAVPRSTVPPESLPQAGLTAGPLATLLSLLLVSGTLTTNASKSGYLVGILGTGVLAIAGLAALGVVGRSIYRRLAARLGAWWCA